MAAGSFQKKEEINEYTKPSPVSAEHSRGRKLMVIAHWLPCLGNTLSA
jgi:hypothetical protein